ncbi:MmgE/PrpD family protein [Tropicimonas sp. IMCC34043]|uniref:MmgE/PrpD family protein n=1 Tax=Tropicimonas sp. IMCC34043 TaxID=2248760 RepID=UPI000E279729|nr:MmgE/PrpD family protein [Tropicimonas sp. IMCC34043]
MSDSPVPLTLDLARALAGLDPVALSDRVARRSGIAFLDTIAVIAAGLREPAVEALARTIGDGGGPPATARDRALLLGTAAHALDYDDVAFGGHVSAVIVPAILSMLPDLPRQTPSRLLLLAYAAGFEAWAEVSARETTLYHSKGGHPTGMLGPLGAAAAAATLLRLDTDRYAHALAIAASLGAGLTVNFGTMTKPFHAGRAAEAGVFAALLAQAGMTAAPDALEARNGFLRVHSPNGDVDLRRPVFLDGGALRLESVAPSVKRFPVCYAAHRAIDAALALHRDGGFTPEALTRIDILISPRHAGTLRYSDPTTVSQARFSLEFAVCTALLTGQVGLSQLTDAWLNDRQLRRLMSRCRRELSDRADPVLEGFAAFDRVTLHRNDAPPLRSPEVTRPLGHADTPLNPDQIEAKLADCISLSASLPSAAEMRDLIGQLGQPTGVPDALTSLLGALLAQAAPASHR